MKKTRKLILKILIFFLILTVPFLTFFIVVEKLPRQYGNTYLAELEDKYRLLYETEERKIVFVGGSSLPFGLRSDLIEQELPDYRVVNFGLYATLGTKLMMDLSKANIRQGDVIVLSPELAAQTYSLYFNPEAVMQAFDGFTFRYKLLDRGDRLSLFYNYYKFAFDKIYRVHRGDAPDSVGIYRHDSFNEYGDIFVDRPNNIMNNGVDSTMSIVMNETLLDDDFIAYVNDFCSFARKKKAKIYFNFSPCNELAVATSKGKRQAFQRALGDSLECDLLTDIEDCIMDYGYFYDTNFHLNSAGAIYYTNLMVTNLKTKLGIKVQDGNHGGNTEDPDQPDNPSIVVPKPPEPSKPDVEEPTPGDEPIDFEDYRGEPNNDYLDYFEYRLVGSSYQITGVKDQYKNMEEVILPSTYNGRNISALASDALYGCINLKRVRIGKTYKEFHEKAFNGCIGLQEIYLYETDGNRMSPASTGLLDGAAKNVRIMIPRGANYETGYTWSSYSQYFEFFDV